MNQITIRVSKANGDRFTKTFTNPVEASTFFHKMDMAGHAVVMGTK